MLQGERNLIRKVRTAALSITLTSKGDYEKITKYLKKIKTEYRDRILYRALEKYGNIGVEALSSATPVDTGRTAASWRYEINIGSDTASLVFHNDNINKYVNIAIILQYGHGTGTGGWVEGRDYINPAIQPIFDALPDEVWKEVTGL